MSRFERALCTNALWRSTSGSIANEIRGRQLGRDVLEIGSGSGSVARETLSRSPELAWTAIDIDPHMTQAAATRLREFAGAHAETADATALPFPDGSFDSVVSCLMLHHIIDWERAVAEVARVLRPGATFVGYDLVRTPLASLFHRLDRSPHRLLAPAEFEAECIRHGLAVDMHARLVGHVMRFTARKSTEEIR